MLVLHVAALSSDMLPVAVRDLAPPGDLTSMQTYNFEFNEVEMQYDSYRGLQVRLRYQKCMCHCSLVD